MDLPIVSAPSPKDKVVNLLPHQGLFVLSADRVLLLDGGFGAAKTLALCSWAYAQCDLYPNNLILLGRHEYTDLADSTIRSFFELIPEGKTAKNWNEQAKVYRHGNGSEILFRHLDDEAGLKNLNLGGVGIDQTEEILPDRFDLLLGRLRRPNASRQIRLTANPNGHDWLWQLFYGKSSILWRSAHVEEFYTASPDYREGYQVIRCSTLDNPHLPPDYVQGLLRDYPPEFVEQYVKGSREVMLGYRFLDQLALRQQVICEPIEVHGRPGVGYFVDGHPKPEWRPQAGGPVRLYELYDSRDPYAIGLDVATGEGSSRCAGVVRNCRMNRVAAVVDADLRPDELAIQGYFLSRYFGNAVLAPERNGIGFAVVSALQQLTSNIFSEQVTEYGVGQSTGRLGWLSDAKSRAELFAQLQREIAGRSLELKDRELIEQCKAITMIRGKPKAEQGFRDDLVIALGITGIVRRLRASLQQQTTVPTEAQMTAGVAGRPQGYQESGAYGYGRGRVKVAGR